MFFFYRKGRRELSPEGVPIFGAPFLYWQYMSVRVYLP